MIESRRQQQSIGGRQPRGRYRILIADDHEILRNGLAAFLAFEQDMQVVGEAQNGREAIDLCRELTPDVVLMDISMPVMNGLEATRAIRAKSPGVRVIVLSMFDEEVMARRAREAGAEAFLSKSESSDELLDAIRG